MTLLVGACTVGAATAVSAGASRRGSGVPLEQHVHPGDGVQQVGFDRELVDELRPQPVQLHRGPGVDTGRQPAGFVRWFHLGDGTR